MAEKRKCRGNSKYVRWGKPLGHKNKPQGCCQFKLGVFWWWFHADAPQCFRNLTYCNVGFPGYNGLGQLPLVNPPFADRPLRVKRMSGRSGSHVEAGLVQQRIPFNQQRLWASLSANRADSLKSCQAHMDVLHDFKYFTKAPSTSFFGEIIDWWGRFCSGPEQQRTHLKSPC